MDSDKRFLALATVLKSDGLKLLVMIRLCPLPYSLSNGALSTINTISPMTFALATALASPKLLIHVFMGSRFAEIAREGGHMDAGTKAINYLAIAFGGILGSTTGYLIYQRTMKRARELEAEERTKLNAPKITRRGPRAANGGLPSPSSFSDDPALAEREELLEDEEAQGADVIDFLENEDVGDEYADEFDDDHDLFHDEEEGIGLNEQRR
ncbi:MAG: Tlg2-vesicle protein [Icmadophila ericetorum]|nr:Tlg2-vesicle protein [Icmadophila ericetorum]